MGQRRGPPPLSDFVLAEQARFEAESRAELAKRERARQRKLDKVLRLADATGPIAFIPLCRTYGHPMTWHAKSKRYRCPDCRRVKEQGYPIVTHQGEAARVRAT